MTLLTVILLALLNMGSTTSDNQQDGRIRLMVENLRNDAGMVRVVLFNSEDGFPGKHEKGWKVVNVKAEQPVTMVTFDKVPHGVYALAVLHDENENGRMDTNFVGMPKEGYGVSNNAKASMFGPPLYDDAVFMLDAEEISLNISLVY
ncbi:MAG: DUF2141 domain-containing protein [Cyclobacteriaceae bacterium]